MNEAIAGLVVLFHPDKDELRRNIASYLPYISRLYIVDNTPGAGGLEDDLLHKEKIFYIANNKNTGIAAALNQGAVLAGNENYQWMLTMDQDSYFEEGNMEKFVQLFRQRFIGDTSVAIVAPSPGVETGHNKDDVIFETAVITSGNLLNLAAWKKLGGFENKLFIDEVDHEYCYRANSSGYKVARFPSVHLNHRLGTERETGYGGIVNRRRRIVHSPRRVYFMVRNYLYVRKKYKTKLAAEFKRRDRMLLTALKNNLLFSGHFFQTLKSIRKGFRDFKKDNFETIL